MQPGQKQNKIFVAGFILIFAIVLWSLLGPMIRNYRSRPVDAENATNAEILKAPLITAKDLYQRAQNDKKVSVIDFSSTSDFSAGHILQSQNIPSANLDAAKLKDMGKDSSAEIILANQGDDVLETAKKTNELVAAGFSNVKYLQGGIKEWKKQGYTLLSAGGSMMDSSKVRKITPDQLSDDLEAGMDLVDFVDLRSPDEFKTGHISGAINLPIDSLEKNHSQLPSIKKIILYGNNMFQSSQAAITLFDLNYFNVFVLDGGLNAWKASGGKIE